MLTIFAKKLHRRCFVESYVMLWYTSSCSGTLHHLFPSIIFVVPTIMFFGYLEVSNFKEKLEAKRVSSTNISQINRPEAILKKVVLKNFAKLTGKHLCWSLFFKKVADLQPAFLFKINSDTNVNLNFVKFVNINKM